MICRQQDVGAIDSILNTEHTAMSAARILSLLSVVTFLCMSACSPLIGQTQDTRAAPQQATAPPAGQVELHKLPGDDLLKQTQALYSQASGVYLAELRGLAAALRQL